MNPYPRALAALRTATAGSAAVVAALAMAAVVATMALVAVPATPALAAIGAQYVTGSSATDSTGPKSVVLLCPAGTVPVGGGASITGAGAGGQVMIRQVRPLRWIGLNHVVVTADEDPTGYAGVWSLSATAFCVPAPSGLRYLTATATDPAQASASVSCGSQHLIGSGFGASATGSVKAAGTDLAGNRATARVERSVVPGATTPVTASATAVCADRPLPGVVQVTRSTATVPAASQFAAVGCPAGTEVIGVGGALHSADDHVVLNGFMVVGSGGGRAVGYWDGLGGAPERWAVSVTATCAG
jgi:hypothetical protein